MAKVLTRIFATPSKYVQGLGAINELGKHVKDLGKRAFVMGGPTALSLTEESMRKSLKESGVEVVGVDRTVKECTHEAINRLSKESKDKGAEVIIGAGGGKAVDTAKAVAWRAGELPVVMVPTQCATNADASALSVVYTEKHEFVEYLVYPKHPELVLVDTNIVGRCPAKFLVRGMGDALACKFEAEACRASSSPSFLGGLSTDAGLALTQLCFENLMKFGLLAKRSMEMGAVTPAVEKIIESIKLLSGVGWEVTGLAAAHAIHNGLTILPGLHAEHGEIVAFGTIAQLVLESKTLEEINPIVDWCVKVGLPTTLAELGLSDVKKEDLLKAAEKACDPNDTMGNMPFPVTPEMVRDAIIVADRIGKERKGK
ncbi:TPA: glycerol dehydrogenase [Candidatus Bathyarchaeota archaeon]|nr:glycerol dehydrogenase [Candidatus Bathyarchaeota archaeon]